MSEADSVDITGLLTAWRQGDQTAFDRLMPLVYAQLRGQAFSLRVRNGNKYEHLTLPLAQNAKYLFVIVSDQNVPSSTFKRYEECGASLGYVALLVLTRSFHPNQPCHSKEEVMNRITICHDAFHNLEREIQR